MRKEHSSKPKRMKKHWYIKIKIHQEEFLHLKKEGGCEQHKYMQKLKLQLTGWKLYNKR